jgi:hypothetical protein
MSIKMTTKIAEVFKDYPEYSKNVVGPHLKSVRSDSVVDRQHVQLTDKNGDVTYVTGTYQTGGGSGYKLLLYTAFECVTDEVSEDIVIIFEYPSDHSQTKAFQKAERTLKKMTKGSKNIRVMNWEQYSKWVARWQKKNPVGSVPRKRASVTKTKVVAPKKTKVVAPKKAKVAKKVKTSKKAK